MLSRDSVIHRVEWCLAGMFSGLKLKWMIDVLKFIIFLLIYLFFRRMISFHSVVNGYS